MVGPNTDQLPPPNKTEKEKENEKKKKKTAEELPRRAARGACAQAVLVKGSLSGPTTPRDAAGHGGAD
jgi:hypothetical protein